MEELTLKFFAYYEDRNNFVHSVKGFLNKYMEQKTESFSNRKELLSIFDETLEALVGALPGGIVRSNRPNSTPLVLFEAVTVGVADIIAAGKGVDAKKLRQLLDDEGLKALTTGATNSLNKLVGRIDYIAERVAK